MSDLSNPPPWLAHESPEKTPGRSQVFSPPPGGLALSDRSGGTLTGYPPLDYSALSETHRARSELLIQAEERSQPTASASDRFIWPTPPYASYLQGLPQAEPEACEIEGVNGKVMQARLTLFAPQHDLMQVQVPPARTTQPQRMNHLVRERM